MDQLWNVLLGNSIVAGALALLAVVAMRLFRRPAMAHALWLLALVKLITPPVWTVSVPWIAVSWEQAAPPTRAVDHSHDVPVEERASSEVDRRAVIEAGMIGGGEALSMMPSASAEASAAPGPVVSVVPMDAVLIAGWLAGALLTAGVFVAHVRRLRRLLRHSTTPSAELVARVRVLSDRLGLPRVPEVALLSANVSPAVCWLGGTTRLLLPRRLIDRLDGAERDALLAHELAHLRRRDHWVRAFEAAVGVVFWWHPLVWLARREIRQAEEQCCDAWVVWALPQAAPHYARALVNTLEFLSRDPIALPPLASGLGRLGQLKRRLTMICTDPAPRTVSAFGRMTLAAVILSLPLAPVLTQSVQATQETAKGAAVSLTESTEHQAVSALINACRDPDEQVRGTAFDSILQFRAAAVPALLEALATEERRAIAIGALQRIGHPAVPALLKGLESRDARLRAVVAEAISQTLGADKAYFPPAPQMDPRIGFVQPMGGRGGYAGSAYGAAGMVPMLGVGADGTPDVEDLQKFEADRKQTAEVLAKTLKDPEAAVRVHIATALAKIGVPDVAVPALLEVMKDKEADVRRAATYAVVHYGQSGRAVAPALIAALKDADREVRNAATTGLLNLGSSASDAVPALVELLKDEDAGVRRAAAAAIGRIRSDIKAQQMPRDGGAPGGGYGVDAQGNRRF